jgi:signal transduction histidine kinase
MTRIWRRTSLLWTFAGSFLAVLIVAAIIQGVIVVTILRPLAVRSAEVRTNLLAEQAAARISWALSDSLQGDIASVLRDFRRENRGADLVFRSKDGRVFTDRRVPPGMEEQFRPIWDSLLAERTRDLAHRGEPGPDRDRRRLQSRQSVIVGSDTAGEVTVLAFGRPGGEFQDPTPGAFLLLLLPVSILVAGIAGLIMFRSVVRRIRALEGLASKVSEGKLDARVSDLGSDEIGRLALSLNTMTESLADARQRVLVSDSQRRQLLADITHELFTPLTSIRGYAETLLEPTTPISVEERATYLDDILDEAKRMDLLINDLLELTRLEAGAITLSKERLDWVALCRNTVSRFQSRFREVGLSLTFAEGEAEAWVEADGRRLEQVIENVLMNAIRYVPEGGRVSVSVSQSPTSAHAGYQMAVEDDGPGFLPEDLPHVFDRFYRAASARSTTGSGLGLAIVQEIVRWHGGQVRAETMQPHGARIVVDLPAAEDS